MRWLMLLIAVISALTLSLKKEEIAAPYKFPKLNSFPEMPVAQDNPVTNEGVMLGRYLFYDPILSIDSTMSCASCHKQDHAFSDAPHRFSRERNGTLASRNTMPLFNLAWYPAFFWDGKATTIEQQIVYPVRSSKEMDLPWKLAAKRLYKSSFYRPLFFKAFGTYNIDSVLISKAIGQFLRTLISYQSKYDQVLAGKSLFTNDEYEGFILMNDQTKGDCIHCHYTDGDALGTSLVFSNNGLDAVSDPQNYKDRGRGDVTGKMADNGKFIVPSLRNLAFTAPYMHDGRFMTLQDVLDFYSSGVQLCANIDSKMEYAHQGGVRLTKEEQQKIIAFLLTMSDSAFVTNPGFSNPFDSQ